jgi:hypothetical protein
MNLEECAKHHPKAELGMILSETIFPMAGLPKDSRFLDLGFREGNAIQWLRSQLPNRFDLLGIDLSRLHISIPDYSVLFLSGPKL